MKCPGCGAEADGRFCGFCGASLKAGKCGECGSMIPVQHRFCSQCGAAREGGAVPASTSAHAAPASGSGGVRGAMSGDVAGATPFPAPPDRRKWWISGAALVGALVFLTLPYAWTSWVDGGNGERMPMGTQALPAPGPAPGVDLSTMTPREAADRLFNRVMTALGSGDRAEVDSFLPMAIDAYRLVPDLDADGHFHLSLLYQAGGDHRSALETAERVLASQPDHLLALYAAGESARGMGDLERAGDHFRHILDVFDAESTRDLPEYREHASLLPAIRESAEDFLKGPGS